MTSIPYTKPSITSLEVDYAADAARNGWGTKCYDYLKRFENDFREHLGVQYAIATSSCTGALHIGLSALGIAPGDEVILADTNWIATIAPITYLGATPVLVDILPDTWCIDPVEVEKAITEKTKAIIAVHLYGNLCDMDALLEIGRQNAIPIIEDAAEAIGSTYHGKPAGSMSAFGAFSFHGTKTMTTGEGGAFVTNDEDLYQTALTLSNHGRRAGETKQFWPERIGFKYRMSNIQAAIGCAQIERIDELIARKRAIFKQYVSNLKNVAGILMNPERPGTTIGAWMPTIVFDESRNVDRDALIDSLKQLKIDARPFFWPLTMLNLFEPRNQTVIANAIYNRALNLPSFHDITDAQIATVTDAIKHHLGE